MYRNPNPFSDGNWATWAAWSSCSVTCGNDGTLNRTRNCDSPTNGGNAVCPGTGDASESQACQQMQGCTTGQKTLYTKEFCQKIA